MAFGPRAQIFQAADKMTSYAAWEQYDVEKVMKQLDEEEAREAKEKEVQQYMRKKDGVVEEAGDSAEVLATKAAVAALKAKRLAQRNKATPGNPAAEVTDLERLASLLRAKSASIQTAMQARKKGNGLVAKSQFTDALAAFQEGTQAVQQLDKVIPQLEDVQSELKAKGTPEKKADGSCEHEHTAGGCGCAAPTPQPVRPSLPQSSDLKGIAKMLHVDCTIGIGKCELERCHYAAASEAFKQAIMRDADNLDAWKLRASAFLRMGAPLIAMLHMNKVVLMEGETGDAKQELNAIEADLVAEPVDDEETYTAAMTYLARTTPHEMLSRMVLLRAEADIIMVEGFYIYSTNKYRAILDTLEATTILPTGRHPALDQLRLACHLNIASGYLEMSKHFQKAADHCVAVLALDPTNGTAHFRLAQAYRNLCKFDLAQTSLAHAAAAFSDAAAPIDRERERIEFDRGELDLSYIKALS
ncbi:Aste57867_1637 [Aphanomyces stellatus]|uniref:peptidylprolyl isomerase n=1 Tax=Aphanomyces stellatus TaxID=120398 RepID=A0A485K6X3_9STRA|nr:hypothetical protein As57867_001635 [Aphanomyces stellatus]VFT78850.1 Aste57867_1637 [Aphanomyces stellatus]